MTSSSARSWPVKYRDLHTPVAVPARDSAGMTAFTILVILGLALALAAIIWPKPYVLPVAVLLLAIALLIYGR
jgi:hypothetical protein